MGVEEAAIGVMQPQVKDAHSYQTLEEARNHLSLQPPEGSWPCRHLGLGQ